MRRLFYLDNEKPMKSPVFFTIISRNYLAYAKTLMESVAATYPDAKRYLCLADEVTGDESLESPYYQVVPISELELPHFEAFVFRYGIMELNTAVKPYMFEWLRRRHADAGIIYLDPDILVIDRLTEVERAFERGASIVLTPHLNDPMDDGKHPGELAIMRSGVYNCGFVAVNAAHPDAERFIAWWADKLEFGAVVDIENGLFTDQKWVDLVPGMFRDVFILRDNGYNVAYWNLAQRKVSLKDSVYYAGGRPISFFHFSGVVLSKPEIFSKHQDRFQRSDIGELQPLYDRYLSLLNKHRHEEHARKPYSYGLFDDGEPIIAAQRRVFRALFDVDSENPVAHPRRLSRECFNEPSRELPEVQGLPISHLMFEIWRMRQDLQQAFNIYSDHGRDGFIRWFLATAETEIGLPDRYISPIRERFAISAAGDTQHAGTGRGAGSEPPRPTKTGMRALRGRLGQHIMRFAMKCKHLPLVSSLYARLPEPWRHAARRRIYAVAGFPLITPLHVGSGARKRGARPVPGSLRKSKDRDGVNLVGYARGEFGVAENVRSYARALASVDYPFVIRNFEVGVASRQADDSMERHFSESFKYDANVFFINADQMPIAEAHLGRQGFEGRYNIGFWLWELENFPDAWSGAFDLVNEIWVPSDFVRDAIAAKTDLPVIKIPKAIEFAIPEHMDRAYFGLPDEHFTFLFSYDFNSFATRKNPEAAVKAFQEAFPRGRDDVRLIIKSINGHRHPDQLAQLEELFGGDSRVEIRDGFLSREEMFGLQNVVDCYLSLHRSEGFGLGMAESMYLGKPVVATAYSGNMEFMDSDNSCLVSYRMTPLGEGEYPFWERQHWAEPSIDEAAGAMRKLADDRAFARRIGEAAARSIRRTHSRAQCAAAVTERLKNLPCS